MRIGLRQFYILGLVLTATFGLLSALTLLYSSYVAKTSAAEMARAIEDVHSVQAIESALASHHAAALARRIRPANDQDLVRARQRVKQTLENQIDNVSETVAGDDERVLMADVRKTVDSYLQAFDRARARAGKKPIDASLHTPFLKALQSLESLVQYNLTESQAMRAKINSQDSFNRGFVGVLTLLALISLGALLFAFRKLIYQPLLDLREEVGRFEQKAANQDLPPPAPHSGAEEIFDIAEKFAEQTKRIADQRNRQLTFLASVAHDLKNPLNAMQMSAEILEEEQAGVNEDQKEIIRIIGRQANYLSRMVADFLDVSSIEAGRFDLQKAPVDLNEVVREGAILFSTFSTSHNLRIDLPSRPTMILADTVRISQVVTNLISNAIKYSPRGGDIKISVSGEGGVANLLVADRGVGIPREDFGKIFDSFQRSPTVDTTIPGLGLGLSIAKKIVMAHGGDITLESRVGEGSTFKVFLPLLEEVRTERPAEIPTLAQAPEPTPERPLDI